MGDMLHAPYEVGSTYLTEDQTDDLRSRSNKAQTGQTDVKRVYDILLCLYLVYMNIIIHNRGKHLECTALLLPTLIQLKNEGA